MILIIIGIEQNIYIISASLFLLRCFFTIITILKAFKGSLVKLKKYVKSYMSRIKFNLKDKDVFQKDQELFKKDNRLF